MVSRLNKSMIVFFLIFLFNLSFNVTYCLSEGNVSPPPLSNVNVHKNVGGINNRFIYMSQETGTNELEGWGDSFSFMYGFSDSIGININLFGMGLSGDDESMSSESDGSLMTINPNFVLELVGGEKKDAAGEIEKLGFSLATYIGFHYTYMYFETDAPDSYTEFDYYAYGWKAGLVSEIPLGKMFSVVPFVDFQQISGGTVDMYYNYAGIRGSSSEDIEESPMTTSYGFDVVIRPFRNSPNFKISLGTAIQQVESNQSDGEDSDNTLIMIGIVYEWGKTYSDIIFGPVTH